jgi:hypothetical protein
LDDNNQVKSEMTMKTEDVKLMDEILGNDTGEQIGQRTLSIEEIRQLYALELVDSFYETIMIRAQVNIDFIVAPFNNFSYMVN